MERKYLIFADFESAEARQNEVFIAMNVTDPNTTRYCDLVSHPTDGRFAVVIEPGYEQYFTAQEQLDAVELTSDWYPEMQ